jgi:phasin family protein
MLTVEQVINARKLQFGNVFGASAKVFEGVEQLARLNLQAGRTALDQCAEACRAMLNPSDPQQLFALQVAAIEPAAARWTGYAGQVCAIVAATNAQLRQLAEQSASDVQEQVASAFEAVLANAPAGSEGAAAMAKSAFAAANTAFQNAQEAWRQAGEAADAQVETMTATLTPGARAERAA